MKKKRVITACVWAMICIVCGMIYCQFGSKNTDSQMQTCKEDNSQVQTDRNADNQSLTGKEDNSLTTNTEISINQQEKSVIVHICGSVKNPGVYSLPDGARIIDAVTAADGFLDTADEDYLNQAQILSDGQKVYIPSKDETSTQTFCENNLTLNNPAGNDNNSDIEGKIDLNSATASELMTLPGIGQAKAKSILAYRQEHGRFESIDEIQKITGIKEAVYEKIKELIMIR